MLVGPCSETDDPVILGAYRVVAHFWRRAIDENMPLTDNAYDIMAYLVRHRARFDRYWQDVYRWERVYRARQEGIKQRPKPTWPDFYRAASESCAGDPDLAGPPRAMKESYQRVQRLLRALDKVGQKNVA
jgi:hypothetical protein